jgi:outer membrane lipoprotein-sorting protein
MTRFLRTSSTRRLLATIAGLIAAIAAGTAIAVAAGGNGPVPPRTSLARAIHSGLQAPAVRGITARITFTNRLIDASNLQGASDPLLSGASGRLWLSADHRLRLELQSDNGDAQVLVNNGKFSVYDPSSKTLYQGTLPAFNDNKRAAKPDKLPSVAAIQRDINQLARHLTVSGAIPSDVAGHAAYTIRVSPKHDGGLLGAAELAWDSAHGIPLRVAVYARGQASPVLELKATDISYGSVPASTFSVSRPVGAKVVKVAAAAGHDPAAAEKARLRANKRHADVSGAAAVARHLPFKLIAPRSLDGLGRRTVTLLDWAGTPAALVAYGQNLGGVAVIEQVAKHDSAGTGQGGERSGLSLPTVSINGATGQELDTALGTMIHFTRGGVAYTLIGSVPAAAAELAARAL